MRTCTTCGLSKSLDQFSLSQGRPRSRCKVCRSKIQVEYQRTNAESHNARLVRWRKQNPVAARAATRRYTAANLDKKAAYNRRYRADNPAWETWRKGYEAINRARRAAQKAARDGRCRRATPSWANKGAICQFYEAAARLTKESGVQHEVDHIVPLTSDFVCGLHWEANLQVLPRYENRSKSNRLIEAAHV